MNKEKFVFDSFLKAMIYKNALIVGDSLYEIYMRFIKSLDIVEKKNLRHVVERKNLRHVQKLSKNQSYRIVKFLYSSSIFYVSEHLLHEIQYTITYLILQYNCFSPKEYALKRKQEIYFDFSKE